ncbi:MAG: hypothetical protein QOG03_2599 [Actinomycetota bacterium]|nr:hypothetical protein [Actinomycetota bacterium]
MVVVCLALVVAGCGKKSSTATPTTKGSGKATPVKAGDKVHWPAPASAKVVGLAQAVAITVGHFETLQHHVHAHLDVFIDGEHTVVPAGIGIAIDEPGVHVFPDPPIGKAYGGITKACANPCISPLHTHGNSGVLHTESPTDVDHTLGQLFGEWDVKLTDTCVGEFCLPDKAIVVYVDGALRPLKGAKDILLSAQREIAVVIGANPPVIPSKGDFSAD